jgi:hypothetical protein
MANWSLKLLKHNKIKKRKVLQWKTLI